MIDNELTQNLKSNVNDKGLSEGGKILYIHVPNLVKTQERGSICTKVSFNKKNFSITITNTVSGEIILFNLSSFMIHRE